jgi:hypothetical protein
MNKTLWTVLCDHKPVAEIAASTSHEAWRIVEALDEFGDLPKARTHTEISSCPERKAAETLRQAKALGVGDRFLALMPDGMVLTMIGGLSAMDPSQAQPEYAA